MTRVPSSTYDTIHERRKLAKATRVHGASTASPADKVGTHAPDYVIGDHAMRVSEGVMIERAPLDRPILFGSVNVSLAFRLK